MAATYSVSTVAKDLFRGVLVVLLLGACALSIILLIFLIFADNSGEGREQAEWCAEYMPEASRDECAAEAGW